ncbi:MAG: UDP-glucuronic acid decarboxylase family protein [Chloroflexota bacterium]
MKVLVAGGAGFIGSHLCERLLSEGYEVLCVDNLITGNEENVEHLLGRAGFRFVRHDVTQPLEADVAAVFHLASPASPPGYLDFPIETSLANSLGTYNLLELARKNNAKFLMASTSEVYGEPLEHPQREDYWGNVNPVGMRSCYDESKRFGESLTMTYRRHLDLDSRIIRIFNTYGPRSDPRDGRIVPNFITQALRSEPITVYGSGEQTRSLCYVADLVEGIMRALFWPGTKGEIVNLGNPDEHTVLEYAQVIKRLCHSNSPIVHVPPISEDDPSRRRPDIGKAKGMLGWEPQVDLEEGLTRTIAWFRQKIGVGD